MSGADWTGRRIHLIGIGGAGMSGLAVVCRSLGCEVTGSDRSESTYVERVRSAGVEVAVGHDENNLPSGAEVVISSAISEDNPELAAARRAGAEVLHRSDLLSEICRDREVMAVAGTHGKTTTTAMIAWALARTGRPFGFFVGGEVPELGPNDSSANAGWSADGPIVVEADESDGSFLRLEPSVAVVTNVEMDHHANWSGMTELEAAFSDFVGRSRIAVVPAGDPVCEGLVPDGVDSLAFSESEPGPADLKLKVPGRHNLLNARAALAALIAAGEDPVGCARALESFPGVARRLEFRGTVAGASVFDDYAHHPTEVAASIEALRSLDPERLVVVFQPHLYSRTRAFAAEFGKALAAADQVVVMDVYPARELPEGPFEGVSGLDVLRATADANGGRQAIWAPDLEAARRAVERLVEPGSVVVTMGAGSVTDLSGDLVEGIGAPT
jgi:UDP-N-acetylmuramate--alanine ligase